MKTAGKPPILRSASPWKLWGLWAAQAGVSLVPAAVILIASLQRLRGRSERLDPSNRSCRYNLKISGVARLKAKVQAYRFFGHRLPSREGKLRRARRESLA